MTGTREKNKNKKNEKNEKNGKNEKNEKNAKNAKNAKNEKTTFFFKLYIIIRKLSQQQHEIIVFDISDMCNSMAFRKIPLR